MHINWRNWKASSATHNLPEILLGALAPVVNNYLNDRVIKQFKLKKNHKLYLNG